MLIQLQEQAKNLNKAMIIKDLINSKGYKTLYFKFYQENLREA